MNEILQVQHLSKTFGTNNVLRDIDFTVSAGDVTSIIGASGSGKSTLLRCINLLETSQQAAAFCFTARTSRRARSTKRPIARASAWCFRASICSTT